MGPECSRDRLKQRDVAQLRGALRAAAHLLRRGPDRHERHGQRGAEPPLGHRVPLTAEATCGSSRAGRRSAESHPEPSETRFAACHLIPTRRTRRSVTASPVTLPALRPPELKRAPALVEGWRGAARLLVGPVAPTAQARHGGASRKGAGRLPAPPGGGTIHGASLPRSAARLELRHGVRRRTPTRHSLRWLRRERVGTRRDMGVGRDRLDPGATRRVPQRTRLPCHGVRRRAAARRPLDGHSHMGMGRHELESSNARSGALVASEPSDGIRRFTSTSRAVRRLRLDHQWWAAR